MTTMKEYYYNTKRPHSALSYKTPSEAFKVQKIPWTAKGL